MGTELRVVGQDLPAKELLSHLASYTGVVGLDTETEGINPRDTAPAHGDGTISCWSLSTELYPKVFLWADQLPAFTPWLESSASLKCGHNIYGFDKHMFANHGIVLQGVAGDTLRLSRLLYCSKERSHGLKALAQNWLGIHQPSFQSLFMRPKHYIEHVQEGRKKGGVFYPLEYNYTKRKVGPHRGVPTSMMSGERGRFGKVLEFIPLSTIPIDYPDRLQALYEYATADADITRQLYYKFEEALTNEEWVIEK